MSPSIRTLFALAIVAGFIAPAWAAKDDPAAALANHTERMRLIHQQDRAVAAGERCFLGLVGIGPHLQAAHLVRPAQDLLEAGLVLEADLDRGQGAQEDLAGRAVEADGVALLEADAVGTGRASGVVDQERRAPGDAGLANLAGHDGGV